MKYPAWPLDLAVLELSEIYHMYSQEFILDEFRGTWEVRILSCASPYFLEYETITGSHGQGWYPHEKDDGDPPVQGGPFCFGSLVANYLQNVGPLPSLKIDIVGKCCRGALLFSKAVPVEWSKILFKLNRTRNTYPISVHEQSGKGGEEAEQPNQNDQGSNHFPAPVQRLSFCKHARSSMANYVKPFILHSYFRFSCGRWCSSGWHWSRWGWGRSPTWWKLYYI